MPSPHRMTAIIEREDDGFVALCPELDIASQGAMGKLLALTDSEIELGAVQSLS